MPPAWRRHIRWSGARLAGRQSCFGITARISIYCAHDPVFPSGWIARQSRPVEGQFGAVVAGRGYQSGYQLILSAGISSVSVGMGRFELPTPCSQIVNRRAREC